MTKKITFLFVFIFLSFNALLRADSDPIPEYFYILKEVDVNREQIFLEDGSAFQVAFRDQGGIFFNSKIKDWKPGDRLKQFTGDGTSRIQNIENFSMVRVDDIAEPHPQKVDFIESISTHNHLPLKIIKLNSGFVFQYNKYKEIPESDWKKHDPIVVNDNINAVPSAKSYMLFNLRSRKSLYDFELIGFQKNLPQK